MDFRQPCPKKGDFEVVEINKELRSVILSLRRIEILFNYSELERKLDQRIVDSNSCQEQSWRGLRKGPVFDNMNGQKGGPQLERMT